MRHNNLLNRDKKSNVMNYLELFPFLFYWLDLRVCYGDPDFIHKSISGGREKKLNE